jgi:hypothetical protein
MTAVRNTAGVAMAVAAFACASAVGAGMSKQDYQAAKKQIAAEYQAQREKCGVRHGNDLDSCVARAHGTRDVAKAELEAEYRPSPRANYDAAIARARAAYIVAKEECDDRPRAQRKGCMKDAKDSLERARTEAKRQ